MSEMGVSEDHVKSEKWTQRAKPKTGLIQDIKKTQNFESVNPDDEWRDRAESWQKVYLHSKQRAPQILAP